MKISLKETYVSAGALAIIAGVVTAALAGTNLLTENAIAKRTAEAENAARREVIEAETFQEARLVTGGEEIVYYLAKQDDKTVGYVFTASVTGKSSGLVVMTGISVDGKISGVKVTENNETAGYVDKVTDAGFLESFRDKAAQSFTLGQEIDAVSQATKTSQGITNGVNQATAWYQTIMEGGGTP